MGLRLGLGGGQRQDGLGAVEVDGQGALVRVQGRARGAVVDGVVDGVADGVAAAVSRGLALQRLVLLDHAILALVEHLPVQHVVAARREQVHVLAALAVALAEQLAAHVALRRVVALVLLRARHIEDCTEREGA